MHDLSPYNLDRTISIHGAIKEISEAEQLISEKLRQYEVSEVWIKDFKSKETKMLYKLCLDRHGVNVTAVTISWSQSKSNANVSWAT